MGDRPFTDIVYGNQNGFLTILTEPLSLNEEPFIVRQVGFCFFSNPFHTLKVNVMSFSLIQTKSYKI